MPYHHQATFSRGEISPELASRVDLELFRSGLYECTNFVTLKRGGFRRRGGTKYIGRVKDDAAARLMKFQFSLSQGYVLEMGDEMFRVWTSAGRVGSVEVTTPYTISQVRDVKFKQSGDLIYLSHASHPPQQIARASDTSWSIAETEFEDGPYLEMNVTDTSLKPFNRGSLTPVMTSSTAPSGEITSDPAPNEGVLHSLFDKEGKTWTGFSGTSGWVAYDLGSGNSAIVDHYALTAVGASASANMITAWTVQGSDDGAAWTTIDSRQQESSWATGEKRFFSFDNAAAFRYHRIKWTAASPNVAAAQIAEIDFNIAAASQAPFNVTAPNGVAAINNGQGFLSTDVGRMIRVRAADGIWRWWRIMSRSSTTAITVVQHGYSLPDPSRITSWRMGAWSEETGYPAAVGFYKDRLSFAGTTEEPLKVWQSQSGDYTNNSISSPLVASDAVTVPIQANTIDPIYWLSEDGDQIVGTEAEIRRIGSDITTEAYGPENNKQDPAGMFGSNSAQPPDMEPLYYWGRYGFDLREPYFDTDRNRMSSRSISEISNHLYSNGVIGGTYQQYPSSVLWQWDSAGRLIGLTAEKDQQVYGFHKHTTAGGTIEWAETIKTSSYDETWLLVKREIDGSEVRYLEVLQAPFESEDIEDAWHLDCAVLYEGAAANTVSGLDHLEGETIIMSTNGADYQATVSGGEASLPDDVTGTKILCGLDVTARAKLLRPAVSAQDGSSVGRKMQVTDAYLDVYQTGSLRVGSDSTYLDEIILYRGGDPDDAPEPLKTGIVPCTAEMRWDEDGQLVIEVSGNKPATVLSANLNLSMEP